MGAAVATTGVVVVSSTAIVSLLEADSAIYLEYIDQYILTYNQCT